MLAALLPLTALADNCGSVRAQPVEVHRSQLLDDDFEFLQRDPDLQFARPLDSSAAVFTVDSSTRFQPMNGFGGAMTESCAINLHKLGPHGRNQVLQSMFSKTSGAGFDYIRMPIGASDFADGNRGSYTYDDSPGDKPDPQFLHFDMSRDEKSFALIREAKKINPNLKVMISPWSPPAWMKTPKTLNGGTLDPNHFEDLANYFVRVIQGLRSRGVPVDSLTIQNEPLYPNDFYPSMGISALDQIRFIRDFLVPALSGAQLTDVGIYVFDHNWDRYDVVNQILDDPQVKRSVRGVAYHCYAGDYTDMAGSNSRHPELYPFQTECSGTLNSTLLGDFEWWLTTYALGPTNLGSTGSMAWNLCLDETGGPKNGGCLACEGLVTTDFSDPSTPRLIYSPEYFALAQLSRFMQPGSARVDVQSSNQGLLQATAFANPDQSASFVVWNPMNTAMNIRVQRTSCSALDYELPPRTAVTLKWQETPALTN